MTIRQRFLRLVYPLYMRLTQKHKVFYKNENNVQPLQSIYTLKAQVNNEELSLETLKGKAVVLVNTASNCGYTAQYKELQFLQDSFKEQLIVIAFPGNDFKQQEKLNDDEISSFCSKYFNVSFPVTQKTTVVKNIHQHQVFNWLTDPLKNGWNDKQPAWNFYKYLINKQGTLTHVFGSGISPLSKEFMNAIKRII